MAQRPPPLTDAELARIRTLHAAGTSRNDMARILGRSGSTISKAAEQMGLSFDREMVKAATAARVADARARRADIMHKLLDDADRLRGQIWEPHEYRAHGGRDFVEQRWTQPEPTSADKHKLMMATSAALTSSMRLDLHDVDSGASTAKSMLGALAAGLGVAAAQLGPDDDDADDQPDH